MEIEVNKSPNDKVKILVETREIQLPEGNYTDNQLIAISNDPKSRVIGTNIEVKEVTTGEVDSLIRDLMEFNSSQRKLAKEGSKTLKFKLLTTK